jgi:ankyrin repeat protein
LHFGADINFRTVDAGCDGKSILHVAVESGSLGSTLWFLNNGCNVNLCTTRDEITPLMIAAKKNRLDMLLLLIKHGALASIHSKDYQGWTALHYAGAWGGNDVVMVLILAGCKTQSLSKAGHTSSNVAFIYNNKSVMELFIKFVDDNIEYKQQLEFFKEEYKNQLQTIDEKGEKNEIQIYND